MDVEEDEFGGMMKRSRSLPVALSNYGEKKNPLKNRLYVMASLLFAALFITISISSHLDTAESYFEELSISVINNSQFAGQKNQSQKVNIDIRSL